MIYKVLMNFILIIFAIIFIKGASTKTGIMYDIRKTIVNSQKTMRKDKMEKYIEKYWIYGSYIAIIFGIINIILVLTEK